MPDTSIIKQISKDFGISMDELLEGGYKNTNRKTRNIIIIIIMISILIAIALLLIIFNFYQKDNDFQFKTLSTECKNFNISGNISYNEKKSAIFINNIKYCGGNDTVEYKSIECTLYESNNNIEKKISNFKSNQEKIKLEDFLKDVTLSIDNYEKSCKEYKENSL